MFWFRYIGAIPFPVLLKIDHLYLKVLSYLLSFLCNFPFLSLRYWYDVHSTVGLINEYFRNVVYFGIISLF